MADELDNIFDTFAKKKPEEKKEEPPKTEDKPEIKEVPKEQMSEELVKQDEKDAPEEREIKPEQKPSPETKVEEKKEETKIEKKEEPIPVKEEKIPETPSTTQDTAIPSPVKKSGEYDFSPAQPEEKHIIMIYGLKGAGKTSLSFSFPKSHNCVSFDKKATSIKEASTNKDHITVFDGARYFDKSSPNNWLNSSEKSWKYLNGLINQVTEFPDWFDIDGGDVFHKMAEMVMRGRNNLMPFQGISNLNVWKERNMYIDQLLAMCFDKSKKGVIWTSYIDEHTEIVDGDFKIRQGIPKWIGNVMMETDVVIRVERETKENGQRFYATVETSKWDKIPESGKVDITNKGISALIKGEI